MRRFSKYFSVEELACRDGNPVPECYYENAKAICARADKLREKVGHPLVVTSGYRTPAYNKKVGGAAKSQHVTASALDLKCHEVPAKELARIWEELVAAGEVPDGGLGVYRSWIHIDIGKPRRWKG
jgi:uncharacterized protein YcbK (DUF882 family)